MSALSFAAMSPIQILLLTPKNVQCCSALRAQGLLLRIRDRVTMHTMCPKGLSLSCPVNQRKLPGLRETAVWRAAHVLKSKHSWDHCRPCKDSSDVSRRVKERLSPPLHHPTRRSSLSNVLAICHGHWKLAT